MDTWSRLEQSWTKPAQTKEGIARRPFSSWTKRCKKSRRARRTIKSDRSKRLSCCFQFWNSFGGRFRVTTMKSWTRRDERSPAASSIRLTHHDRRFRPRLLLGQSDLASHTPSVIFDDYRRDMSLHTNSVSYRSPHSRRVTQFINPFGGVRLELPTFTVGV